MIILKYDLDGNYIWSLQEDFDVDGPGLTTDQEGNVIVSGTFLESAEIGTEELVSYGIYDGFVAKYNGNGNFLWAIQAGGEDYEWMAITSTDASNNIYLSGEFYSINVLVDQTSITMEKGDGNVLFSKINANGEVQWIKSFAASHHDWYDDYCWPTGIITGPDGYTYLKGSHRDTAYFDEILLTNPYNRYSKFIVKIDSDGNALWAKTINTHYYGYLFDYNQFDIDIEGNVYFGVQATDTLNFVSDFQYVATGNYDLLVAKYTSSGDLDWVKIMEGQNTTFSWLSSVAVYGNENVFAAGILGDYLAIDNEEMTATNRHGFLTMFGDDIVGIRNVYSRNKGQFDIYPNPATEYVIIETNLEPNTNIELLDITGKIIYQIVTSQPHQLIEINHLAAGIYLIKAQHNGQTITKKLIVR